MESFSTDSDLRWFASTSCIMATMSGSGLLGAGSACVVASVSRGDVSGAVCARAEAQISAHPRMRSVAARVLGISACIYPLLDSYLTPCVRGGWLGGH